MKYFNGETVRMLTHFINVDDDQINNMLCEMTIKNYFPGANVQAFSNPEEGLKYIQTTYSEQPAPFTLLFLDINMPAFDGWEFLEEFDHFSCSIKDKIKICMLSSSVDIRDKKRAYNNKNVFDYVEKPLTIQSIDIVIKKLLIPESI